MVHTHWHTWYTHTCANPIDTTRSKSDRHNTHDGIDCMAAHRRQNAQRARGEKYGGVEVERGGERGIEGEGAEKRRGVGWMGVET